MHPTHHARTDPHKPAIIMGFSGESVSFRALDDAADQGAHSFRAHGLQRGDVIALVMDNSPRFLEIAFAAQRSGLYYACLSTRLVPAEIAYILADSGAKAVFVSPDHVDRVAEALTLMPAGSPRPACWAVGAATAPGGEWRDFLADRATRPLGLVADASAGTDMLYSSGTTGRPKGIRTMADPAIDAENPLMAMTRALYGASKDSIYLSTAPLYHAAPLRWTMTMIRHGATAIVMERFDPGAFLQLIDAWQVTHTQAVPTMFVKLLKLPEAIRARYDVSSLRMAIHAAAPCPIPVKEQMIAWWGNVIYEYYAGTEGNGYCSIGPEEWLLRKGSVGRAILGRLRIRGEEGAELGPGEIGTVYFSDGRAFEYHNDPEKTAAAHSPEGWTTLGDIGHVDTDGYLFLTDRKAFMIISGGVNIYPQEAENVLVTHPKVADAAVIGVPDEEFGEVVKAVVEPLAGTQIGPALEAELIAFCRSQLSPVKCPRSVDFVDSLPREPTGKLMKRALRDKYWPART